MGAGIEEQWLEQKRRRSRRGATDGHGREQRVVLELCVFWT
jgi:hypothetical protein